MEPVYFSVTSSEDPQNSLRFVLGQKDEPLKVGRNKKSSIVVTQTGISWVHLEIRPSQKGDEQAEPSLCVRDVSSNGVGLRRSRKGELQRLEKDVDTELPPGASLEMPFRVKPVEGQSEDTLRTVLHLSIDGIDSPSSELTDSEPEELELVDEEDQQSKGAAKALPSESMFNPEASPEVERQRKRKAKGVTTNDKERPAKERKSNHNLTPGQFVKVVGLKGGKASLNGKSGLLVEWDPEHSAWKVRMEDGSGKAFRPNNLEPHQIKAPTLPLPGPGSSQAAAQGTGGSLSAPPPPPPEVGPAPGSQSAAPGPPLPGNKPLQPAQAMHAAVAAGLMPGLPQIPTMLPMPTSLLPMGMLPGMMSMTGMPLGMPLLPGLMGGLPNPFSMPTLPPRMPLPTRPARPP